MLFYSNLLCDVNVVSYYRFLNTDPAIFVSSLSTTSFAENWTTLPGAPASPDFVNKSDIMYAHCIFTACDYCK
jgi:hypothetical protein